MGNKKAKIKKKPAKQSKKFSALDLLLYGGIGCLAPAAIWLAIDDPRAGSAKAAEIESVPTETRSATGIVVVDSKAILRSFMSVMEERIAGGEEMSEGKLNLSGQEFAAEYMRAIKKYKDDGFIVIDKQYALGVPSNTEITLEIGNALGLSVEVTPDPFSMPVLQ